MRRPVLRRLLIKLLMQHDYPVPLPHGQPFVGAGRLVSAREVLVVIFSMMGVTWTKNFASYANHLSMVARNANVLEEEQIRRKINTEKNIEHAKLKLWKRTLKN